MKIGIILTPDERSKAYIQKLLSINLNLYEIIFMNDSRLEKSYHIEAIKESKKCGFDITKSVHKTLIEKNLQFKEFNFVDINHPDLINYLKKIEIDYMIFTGGGILRRDIQNLQIKFIHLHPGIVPFYRGSTCFYYSILKEDMCGVTAYIMDENIDTGKVIYQKKFKKPNHIFLDEVYDPYIRAETLLYVLKNKLLKTSVFKKQDPSKGNTFFIIHPVLKHIAILSCINSND